ncbi:MAG: hypothetical protein JWL77_3842 [Chthonomonadaceae bacterium]|nr:hypothetical protein [Chthonomonadaceae bacterium]
MPYSDVEECPSGVGVSVEYQPAFRAEVDPIGEGLALSLLRSISTTRTVLRGESRVDVHDHTTSAFSLVREGVTEHSPACIPDRFVEACLTTGSIAKELPCVLRVRLRLWRCHHVFDLKLFDSDQAETVDEPASGLVNEVMATVLDPLVYAANDLLCFLARFASVIVLHLVELSRKPLRGTPNASLPREEFRKRR